MKPSSDTYTQSASDAMVNEKSFIANFTPCHKTSLQHAMNLYFLNLWD